MRRRTTYTSRLALLLAGVFVGCPGAKAAGHPDAQRDGGGDLLHAQQHVFRAALRAVSPYIVRVDTIGGALPVEEVHVPGRVSTLAPGFRQADGPTTGLICSDDGYILTSSFNFLRDPSVITVRLADGRRFVARLVARDRPAGLALLRIEAQGLPAPRWVPRDELRPGQWALAAGYGHNTGAPALSVGVLSALERLEGRAVQTDAKTSPANYGGPLFDVEGRVLGICVPMAGTGADEIAGVEWYDSGIGFAVHGDYIHERLPRLKLGRDLQRGLLGVRFDPTDMVASSREDTGTGVRIVGLMPGPAADAGLEVGDVITQVNAHPTPRLLSFRRALARSAAGDVVGVTYRRGAQTAAVSLTLVTAEELQARATTQSSSPPQTQPSTAPGSASTGSGIRCETVRASAASSP